MPKLQKRIHKKGKYKSVSYSVTLPKDYVDDLDWKEQDHILVRKTEDNKLLLEKA